MKNQSKIALGTWSWGAGFAGGDQVFGNNLGVDELRPVFDEAMANGVSAKILRIKPRPFLQQQKNNQRKGKVLPKIHGSRENRNLSSRIKSSGSLRPSTMILQSLKKSSRRWMHRLQLMRLIQ